MNHTLTRRKTGEGMAFAAKQPGIKQRPVMKNFCLLIAMTALFISCRSKRIDGVQNTDSVSVFVPVDSNLINKDSHYYWEAELAPGSGLIMKKTRPIPPDSLTTAGIIEMLNGWYPEIPVRFSGISNDSITVRILKSTYLTEQMGSSGAKAYLAELTYNLTELKGINYVNIRFKAGDHASPDTYTRTDFIRLRDQ